ncbi:FtsX-like permease family protein [Prolixibacteraceae bacterium JC049]|nr:FtsX-like permease family protein [Prolixibacteraceae bacterium JC049]
MVLTDLKVAVRNLLKHKTISAINIVGLGIGLGAIFLLSLLVIHEYSFNKSVPDNDALYRVLRDKSCQNPYLLAQEAKADIPEIESFFRFYQIGTILLKDKKNQVLEENWFAVADKEIFSLWGVNFIAGVPAKGATQVAISKDMAKKYLGDNYALGSTINVKFRNKFVELEVCGVYENFASNSTLYPNFIGDIEMSGALMGQTTRMLGLYGSGRDEFKNWKQNNYYTYLKLNKHTNAKELAQKLQVYNQQLEENHRGEFKLQSVKETYLNSNDLSGAIFSRFGNAKELAYYMGIALVVLFIAIVNYVFLTRAKIMGRLTELGAKKAIGATDLSIQKQVILESTLISALSAIPATLIVVFGMNFINTSLGKSLGLEVFSNWYAWLLLVAIVAFTGIISGIFISLRISKTSTVKLLAGLSFKKKDRGIWDNSFLSFHYAIFIILLVAVFVFKKQINYSLNNFKSINPENILVCGLNTPELQKQVNVLRNELEKTPGVEKMAGSSFVPPFNSFLPIRLRSKDNTMNIRFDGLIMGKGMTELLEMEFVDGEPFGELTSGSTSIIFNESAATKYGLKVGEPFNGFHVRGIVKDFTAHSTRKLIEPMAILQQHPSRMRFLVIKTDGKNDEVIIAKLKGLIKQLAPSAFIDINYLTDQINQFYRREQNQARLITAFSILAIVLAVMGLFGIVLNTISKRTKEIGIRKVNGATIGEVLVMLNQSFIKWIIFSIILAYPLAWYIMNQWLGNFAYKTSLSWWIFALAGALALGIALLTVTWQSWRAANRNPIEALRYE